MPTPAPDPESIPRWRRLTWLVTGFLLSFAVVELAARVVEYFVPPVPIDIGLGFDPRSRVFVAAPDDASVRVTAPQKRHVFNVQRFTAAKAPGVTRVIALGESSIHLLEGELEALERQSPRLEILNLGGHGYGSHRLVPVLVEMLDYAPDLVVIYIGNNEFEEAEQLELAQLDSLELQRTTSHLAIFRVIRDVFVRLRVDALRSEHNDRILAASKPDHARAWQHPFTSDEVAARMTAYEANLRAMAGLCRDRGVAVVIGTVPSNRWKPLLPAAEFSRWGVVEDHLRNGRYVQADALGREILSQTLGRHQSSDVENAIIRRIAKEEDVPLIDVEAAVVAAEPHGIPGETLFQDHCHLNKAGKQIWIQTATPFLRL